MAVWGKIVGGLAGFAVGGPLGALLGAAGGHMWDRKDDTGSHFGSARSSSGGESMGFSANAFPGSAPERRQEIFGLALVALAAKLSKADGQVTPDEIRRFRSVFPIDSRHERIVGQIFDAARRSHDGYQDYAQQVAIMFADSVPVRETLLWCLVAVALADGELHPNERTMLEDIAAILGMPPVLLDRIITAQWSSSSHGASDAKNRASGAPGGSEEADSYAILGVSPNDCDDDIRQTYRRLVRQHHPDHLMAQGVPQDALDIANRKLAQINNAYDVIKRQRGIS